MPLGFVENRGQTDAAVRNPTGERIGTLSGGQGKFDWPTNPQRITVRSSLGGSATANVS